METTPETTPPVVPAVAELDATVIAPETAAGQAWRRFRRHPGAVVGTSILALIILAVTFSYLSPYDPEISDIPNRYQAPSFAHPFGTDGLGRDLMTRALYGGRVSISVGVLVVVISLLIGVPVGAVAGYFGGWVDNLLMRIIDTFLTLPSLLILILLAAILREVDVPFLASNSVMTIAFVIGILSWMTVARLVRAVFLTFREMEYVEAARVLGASNVRIMMSEILPNGFGPIIVAATLQMGNAIMVESGLSFIGFGIQPPTPSWGNLLSNAQEHLTQYFWLAFFPGIFIFLSIISINYIGDGLRDALDPFKVLSQIDD
jgi:peptide/nickel transport system permease protein